MHVRLVACEWYTYYVYLVQDREAIDTARVCNESE